MMLTRRSLLESIITSGPFVLLASNHSACSPMTQNNDSQAIRLAIKAIWFVESACSYKPKDGDNGLAIGPFQVHRSYWLDACRIMHIKWPYEYARQYDKAEKAVLEYLRFYTRRCSCLVHVNNPISLIEHYCRIHNGGPNGMTKQATVKYWQKCYAYLKKEKLL